MSLTAMAARSVLVSCFLFVWLFSFIFFFGGGVFFCLFCLFWFGVFFWGVFFVFFFGVFVLFWFFAVVQSLQSSLNVA